jgi:hypothetical protein
VFGENAELMESIIRLKRGKKQHAESFCGTKYHYYVAAGKARKKSQLNQIIKFFICG